MGRYQKSELQITSILAFLPLYSGLQYVEVERERERHEYYGCAAQGPGVHQKSEVVLYLVHKTGLAVYRSATAL